MNEMTISRFTAAIMLTEYYKYHYYGLVDAKVKPKVENNDLYMKVKLSSKINHKRIVEHITLNQGDISNLLSDYMELYCCKVNSITYEPYFHNLCINYTGEYENIKPVIKLKRVYK